MRKRELERRLLLAEKELNEIRESLSNDLIVKQVIDPHYYHPFSTRTIDQHEVTIDGKVNAILKHLGLSITVTQEKTVGAKINIKKKATKKKNGTLTQTSQSNKK